MNTISMDDHHAQPTPVAEPLKPKEQEITFFAQTNFRNENRRFGIKIDDRRRHMYVIGKTGMGKSTLLENMIIQDIQNGKGVAVVDPHGDLVEKVINFIPKNRINDVVYFNPADVDHPISFNILENVGEEYKNLVSNGLVGVFKKIWADSWGPRLEYILINAILGLLEYPGSTLLGVTRMLVDAKYRKKVVNNISDPVVKSFWVDEFNNYTEKFRNEAIAPIQNKVGQFLSSSLIRNIVGQSKSTIDMRELMDSGKILLMNLSKGRVGEENAALLGAMMITKIQLAAMSRVDIPEPQRRDFYLYVDEFQNFSTESFANILSEARKYRLNLIMAHQYIEQLSDEVKAAVFGNVGTLVAFRVGATDAEELEKEFQPTFMQEDIVTLPAHHVYLRLMIDGVASEPFSASTLPPISGQTNQRDKVIAVSREHYGRDRAAVEEKIRKWAGYAHGDGNEEDDDAETAAAEVAASKKNDPVKAPVKSPSGDALLRANKPIPSTPQPQSSSNAAVPSLSVPRPPVAAPVQQPQPARPVQPVKKIQQSAPVVKQAPPAKAQAEGSSIQPNAKPRIQPSVPQQPRKQPNTTQPQNVQHELEDLRSKKISFVSTPTLVKAPVVGIKPVSIQKNQPQNQAVKPQQPKPQVAQKPLPRPPQQPSVRVSQQPATPRVEFSSLADALPAGVLPHMQQKPAPVQAPATQRPVATPSSVQRQPVTQVAQSQAPVVQATDLGALAADGTKKKRRRRRRKKSGNSTQSPEQGQAVSPTMSQQSPVVKQPAAQQQPAATLKTTQPQIHFE